MCVVEGTSNNVLREWNRVDDVMICNKGSP